MLTVRDLIETTGQWLPSPEDLKVVTEEVLMLEEVLERNAKDREVTQEVFRKTYNL